MTELETLQARLATTRQDEMRLMLRWETASGLVQSLEDLQERKRRDRLSTQREIQRLIASDNPVNV
jgi:hypothetical protein